MRILLLCMIVTVYTLMSSAHAEPSKRVIILESMHLSGVQQATDWMLSQLAEVGFHDGKNLEVVRLNAEGTRSKGMELLRAELDQGGPADLVISAATVAAQATHQVLKDRASPHMFFYVFDPAGAGLIEGFGLGRSNITGRSHSVAPEIRLQLLTELLSPFFSPIRIGVLHTTYPASRLEFAALQRAAEQVAEVEIVSIPIQYQPEDTDHSAQLAAALEQLQAVENEIDVIVLNPGPNSQSPHFVRGIIDQFSRPIVYGPSGKAVRNGALMALYADPLTIGTDAGNLAARLLSGMPPEEVPPGRLDRFAVSLNMATAAKLGIVFPSHLLELAGENLIW